MAATRIGKGRTVTCKMCNESGLRWDRAFIESTVSPRNPNGVMRLWNPATGEVHACQGWRKRLSPHENGLSPVQRNHDANTVEDDEDEISPPIQSSDALSAIQSAISSSGISRSDVERMIRGATDALSIAYQSADSNLKSRIEASHDTILNELLRMEKVINSNRKIELVTPVGEVRILDRQHKSFQELLTYAQLRCHVMMVGPAGGGKTTASEKVAEALGLEYTLFPMGPAITESRLLGWMDANGKYVTTSFRNAYENGGIFMADEIDNSNPSALTVLNGALANGQVSFPDRTVMRHPDFIFMGGANTYGRGADRIYVGRAQLDGATLDRFLTLDWDYDEEFELELAGGDQKSWVQYVQRVRAIAFANKLRVIVSPRASIEGARLLRNGVSRERVESVRLWAGMPEAEKSTIKANLR